MNSFEFGFFSELEKIATDPRAVNAMKKHIQDEFKGIARGEAGQRANQIVQALNRTRSRFHSDIKDGTVSPRKALPGLPGSERPVKIMTPNASRKGTYIPATEDIESKVLDRMANAGATRLSDKFMPAGERIQIFGKRSKPYGHSLRGMR